MRKRILSVFMALAMVLSLVPVTAFAGKAEDIKVSSFAYTDENKTALKSMTADFFWDSGEAEGRLVLMKNELQEGDLTNLGKYGREFDDFDAVLGYDKSNGTFGILSYALFDNPLNGNCTVTFDFSSNPIPVDEAEKYYVYLWTYWQGHCYPDQLFFVIDVKDGKITYTTAVDRSEYNEDYFKSFGNYIVVFNANRGSGNAMETVEKEAGESYTLPACEFTRDGYTFGGWNTQENGNGTSYAVGNTVTMDKDYILYAKWIPNTYSVAFDANGGVGTMENQTFTHDQSQRLTANAFTRDGYTFDGWNTAADGSGEGYGDKNYAKMVGNTTLYAQWKENAPATYAITASNDGNGTASASVSEAKAGDTVTLTATPNSGYQFKEWRVVSGGVTIEDNRFTMPEGAVEVKAIFEIVPYRPSSGSGSSKPKYSVSVDNNSIDNGSVKLSSTRAKAGSKVTVTVTPDAGYKLDELKILDKNGKEISVVDNGDGTFTFTMPQGGVEVVPEFVAEIVDTPVVVPEKEETTLVLTIGQTVYQKDGEYKANDAAPIIKADRTMLPIRLIAEALGATVTWSEADQAVTIVKDDTTIVVYINQVFALVNGEPVQLDAPAFIANDRTYLPVRFVSETLGAAVAWDAVAQTVTIEG